MSAERVSEIVKPKRVKPKIRVLPPPVQAVASKVVEVVKESDQDRYNKLRLRLGEPQNDPRKHAEDRLEAYWLQIKLGRSYREVVSKIDLFWNRLEQRHPQVYQELIEPDLETGLTKALQIRNSVLPKEVLKKVMQS